METELTPEQEEVLAFLESLTKEELQYVLDRLIESEEG